MDKNIKIYNKRLLESVKDALIKNGFKNTKVFDTSNEAVEHLCLVIGSDKKIGVGGSQTVRELGLLEIIKQNNQIITHTSDMDEKQRRQVWFQAQQSDFYLASPQAVTLNGELIFLDAYGNRVSSCIYGPKKVILIFGYNKIVKNVEEGIERARNFAAVLNNLRLKRKNPCVTIGSCQNCSSLERICNVLTILYKKPNYTEYEIVAINESLGY